MTKPDNSNNPKVDERSVISVICDIQQGKIKARSLATEDRKRCVEHFTCEGYSIAEIAEILKVADRTIARDKAAIRQANSVEHDPQMAAQMVGQLISHTDTCIQHIRKASRERGTPPNVRIEGEKACWTILDSLARRLQSLGYLPTAPQQFQGEVKHQVEHVPAFGQMNEEVSRLEIIIKQSVLADGENQQPLLEQLASIKDQVSRGVLHEEIASIATQVVENKEVNNAQSNE